MIFKSVLVLESMELLRAARHANPPMVARIAMTAMIINTSTMVKPLRLFIIRLYVMLASGCKTDYGIFLLGVLQLAMSWL